MVEIRSGNQHSRSANRNWFTNSPPYGYGGRSADMTVLPVRIIMSPTCSSRFLVGRNARSATARTKRLSSPLPPEAYGITTRAYNRQPSGRKLHLMYPLRWYVHAALRGRRAQSRTVARSALLLVLAGVAA